MSERRREPADQAYAAPVVSSEVLFSGPVFDVRRDVLDLHGDRLTRDVVVNRGAVAVVALDDEGRVVLLRQYRHPVGLLEWELPAGLLDVPGEDPLEAARRELAEEVDLRAERWQRLLHHASSPGFSTEYLTTYLAEGLSPVPEDERHDREGEEAHLEVLRVPLEEAVAAALDGRIGNAVAIIGLLAVDALRRTR